MTGRHVALLRNLSRIAYHPRPALSLFPTLVTYLGTYVPAIVLPSQDDVVLTCKLADKATLRGTYRYVGFLAIRLRGREKKNKIKVNLILAKSDGPERQRPAKSILSLDLSNHPTKTPGQLMSCLVG
ncbi:hypothetical protein PoMZ_00382 [Pyricularia oryzae]|uniref:Uncharacterized protein n=1 Tax=Pyricularia oryzae TaxID=318829 RepID=A0A4P7N627_PYROR|nr:hypothetical protein PoMZ_00382 [Pyricularia oryzae]